jgi:hypothetical protein
MSEPTRPGRRRWASGGHGLVHGPIHRPQLPQYFGPHRQLAAAGFDRPRKRVRNALSSTLRVLGGMARIVRAGGRL